MRANGVTLATASEIKREEATLPQVEEQRVVRIDEELVEGEGLGADAIDGGGETVDAVGDLDGSWSPWSSPAGRDAGIALAGRALVSSIAVGRIARRFLAPAHGPTLHLREDLT